LRRLHRLQGRIPAPLRHSEPFRNDAKLFTLLPQNAVLHHPEYRERYAANPRRELPRIPPRRELPRIPFAANSPAFPSPAPPLLIIVIPNEVRDLQKVSANSASSAVKDEMQVLGAIIAMQAFGHPPRISTRV